MPLSSDVVGNAGKRFRHEADARWIMAYAAGLGDWNERYFDTSSGVIAHPLFPVCVEWPVVLDARNIEGAVGVTPEEGRRGVHATHDLHLHRPVRQGDELFTRATIVGVEQRKPGAYQMMRLDTQDAAGRPVATTYQGALLRDVAVSGGDRWSAPPPTVPTPGAGAIEVFDVPVAPQAAHVYTECARIFNPIHTDRKVALAAGLPGLILHGTATLALAVSRLVDERLAGDPTRVRRIACRFSAMVLMPSTVRIELLADGDDSEGLFFNVLTGDGTAAIRDGFLGFG